MPKAAGLINSAVHPALPLLWQVTAGSAITLEFFVFLCSCQSEVIRDPCCLLLKFEVALSMIKSINRAFPLEIHISDSLYLLQQVLIVHVEWLSCKQCLQYIHI